MTEQPEPNAVRLPPDFWPLVDAWSQLQHDRPCRAEAVRRLVAAGINAQPSEKAVAIIEAIRDGIDGITDLLDELVWINATPKEPKEPKA